VPGVAQRLVYVPDDPAWTVDSSRLRDYFYRHVRDLTAVRAELAADLAAGRWPLLLYFDPLLGLIEQAYSADGEEENVALDAYATIDARIGALAQAAGPGTAIVLVGREPAAGQGVEHAGEAPPATGFLFVDAKGGASSSGEQPAQVTQVATTLRRLLRRDLAGATPVEAKSVDAGGVPLTAASLRRLGLLTEQTQAPVAGNGDVSAATTVKPE
jgi:hypothetical protein